MKKLSVQEILTSTIKELMDDRSIDEITVKDILRESGIGRSTFYKYFCDKQELIEYIFQQELAAPFFWDFSKDLQEREELFLQYLLENRRFYLNALKSTGQNSLYQIWLEQAIHSVQQYLRQHPEYSIIPQDDLAFYAKFISYAYVNINIEWLELNGPIPPEEMARKLGHILTGGMKGILLDTIREGDGRGHTTDCSSCSG